jgi:hypothetical protein
LTHAGGTGTVEQRLTAIIDGLAGIGFGALALGWPDGRGQNS